MQACARCLLEASSRLHACSAAMAARWDHSRHLARALAFRRPPPPPPARRTLAAAAAEAAVPLSSSVAARKERPPRPRRLPYKCPSCGQNCFRPEVLHAHLSRCCPDLLATERAAPPLDGDTGLRGWLEQLRARELELHKAALDVAFLQVDAQGKRLRQGSEEVGAALGLPPCRAAHLLLAAMRAVPLAADTEHAVEVLYEDSDLLAVNKPPGVISAPKHRYTGGSMVNRVIGRLGFEPLTLHRLDQWTSGVLLFAKTRDTVAAVHAQFRARSVEKQYLALAVGVPEPREFSVDAPLERDERDKVARKVDPLGKPALTGFRVVVAAPTADLSAGHAAVWARPSLRPGPGGASLVVCKPHTGRTHQIRVHLAHAGHPIVGDDLYGITGPWLGRQALHAAGLRIEHPRTGRSLDLRAPLPDDIADACRQLGLELGGDVLGRHGTEV